MRPEAAFPFVFAAEGAQHPPNKPPRSTTLRSHCKKIVTNLPEDILVTLYYVRWSCVRNLLIVRTGGLPPSLRSGRLRPERQVLQERLALQVLQEHAYDSNGNITCDPLCCFEIRYNLLNLASEVIGHDPEESADSATASAGDGTTRYIGSLIYEGEPGQETFEGVSTDYGDITPHWLNCLFKNRSGVLFYCC